MEYQLKPEKKIVDHTTSSVFYNKIGQYDTPFPPHIQYA